MRKFKRPVIRISRLKKVFKLFIPFTRFYALLVLITLPISCIGAMIMNGCDYEEAFEETFKECWEHLIGKYE